MLRWRVAAAAVILIPLIALFVADLHRNAGAPGIWLVVPGLVLSWITSAEVLDMFLTTGSRPLGWTVYAGTTLVFLAACLPMVWQLNGAVFPTGSGLDRHGFVLVAAVFAVGLAFLGEMWRFQVPNGAMNNLALSVLTISYVGMTFSFAVALRQFHSNAWGMAALVSTIFVVKLSDTGAYFVGKSFGRRKSAPKLSPGKTVEGGIGGLVAAVVASCLFFQLMAPWITGDWKYISKWGGAVLYGITLGCVGLVGDLSESLLKRDVQRKDSSSWLPGLGGVLDVMDSLLFAMPAAYVFWALGLVGPDPS